MEAFRIIRITRILKTVQVVRVFRFVMALRTLVTSIFHTLKALTLGFDSAVSHCVRVLGYIHIGSERSSG